MQGASPLGLQALPEGGHFVLGQILITLKPIFIGIKNGQALVCQHLRLLQLREREEGGEDTFEVHAQQQGQVFKPKQLAAYRIIRIPLEELEIGIIQVLSALHALGRGSL